MEIPPWLHTPNYPAVMQAGTSAGLALRGQLESERARRSSENEAASRLQLAYEQLAAQEERASEAAQQRLHIAELETNARSATAAAALAQQMNQAKALQAYREKQTDLGERRLEEQIAHNTAAEALKDVAPEPFSLTLPSGREVEGIKNPRTGHYEQVRPQPDPTARFTEKEKNRLASKLTDLGVNLQGELGKPVSLPGARESLTNKMNAVRGELDKLRTNNAASVLTNAPVASDGTERVSVISPTGKRGTIPKSQLDEALREGYKLQ